MLYASASGASGSSCGSLEALALDGDAADGIVASTPCMAQNEHYKREAPAPPAPATAAGNTFPPASTLAAGPVNTTTACAAGGGSAVAEVPGGPSSAAASVGVAGAATNGTGGGGGGGNSANSAAANASNNNELLIFDAPPAVYTSTLPRTMDMVHDLPFSAQALSALNPMETGICLGIPLQYLQSQFPEEYAKWKEAPDRARYRIPGGESLMDVVARLTPFVIEMERQRKPVLIVSHLSTLQVLLAYFKGVPVERCIELDFPMNTVIEFTPHQYGWLERRFTFTQIKGDDSITTTETTSATGTS